MANFDVRAVQLRPVCELYDDKTIDYHTGLPFHESLSQSPFHEVADYLWYIYSFSPIPVRFTTNSPFVANECSDHVFCIEIFGRSAPLHPPIFSKFNYTLSEMSGYLKEALWHGYPSAPCNSIRLAYLCKILRKANYFPTTPIFLKMIIQRDCVKAYTTVIRIFGRNDYAGSNYGRIKFFIKMRKHLLIWQSVNIKNYLYQTIAKMAMKGKIFFPTEIDIQNEAPCPTVDNQIKLGHQPDDPYFLAEHGDIRFIHCPFQALQNNFYSCSELELYRFYDMSNIRNLDCLFKNPGAEFA